MGLGDNLLFFWKHRKQIKEASGAVDNIKEAYVKDGYKTTEFWMTICTNIVTIVGALQGVIPADTASIILAVANGVYGVLRVVSKKA